MTRAALLTRSLRLDPLGAGDVDAVHALLVDPNVRRYLCDDRVLERDEVAAFVELSDRLFVDHGAGLWCVRQGEGALDLVGLAGYFWFHEQLELLYALVPAVWGRGLATEASTAALRFGFESCGLDRVVASTDEPNVASVGVMRRLGMAFDRSAVVDGLATIFYSIERDAFDHGDAPYIVDWVER